MLVLNRCTHYNYTSNGICCREMKKYRSGHIYTHHTYDWSSCFTVDTSLWYIVLIYVLSIRVFWIQPNYRSLYFLLLSERPCWTTLFQCVYRYRDTMWIFARLYLYRTYLQANIGIKMIVCFCVCITV